MEASVLMITADLVAAFEQFVYNRRSMSLSVSNLIQYPFTEFDALIKPHLLLSQTNIFDFSHLDSKLSNAASQYRLLQIIRENRIVDSFVGFSCFSHPPYPRKTLSPQTELTLDEVYFGINKFGNKQVIPVISLGKEQPLWLSMALRICESYYAEYASDTCHPIITQFLTEKVIAFWVFEFSQNHFALETEKHYRLVRPDELSKEELAGYRKIEE